MTDPREISTLVSLIRGATNDSVAAGQWQKLAERIRHWDVDDLQTFLRELSEFAPSADATAEQLLRVALQRFYHLTQGEPKNINAATLRLAGEVYQRLGPGCRPRWYLLAALAAVGEGAELQDFARLFSTDPPADHQDAATALAPLFQRANYDPADVFPRLLDALAHPQAASPVLDLANFLTRNRQAPAHPAREIVPRLTSLLKGVCAQLEKLAQQPLETADPLKSQHRVSDSVAIAASLCDALGLLGDEQAKTALQDALHLPHRRIRVEAAAALARMGDDDAIVALVELAEHPNTRLRAIAYAEELGLLDHIDEAWRSPTATAEAELACYLAEPQQLGAAPSDMEVIDQRTLVWPSYDEPQECYLIRFTYRFGDGVYVNVGIAGPLVHTFHVDLTQLPLDDVYAIFAGWQAEHPDIREVPAANLNDAHQAIADNIKQRLAFEGVHIDQLVALGLFLGDPAIIATARQDGTVGAIVAGLTDAAWFPHDGASPRPLGPNEAWNIWKGRRLLKAFNDGV